MFTLYKKEVSSFLNSLLGYIVIAVFLLVNGLFLWVFPLESNIPDFGYANLDGLFTLAPFVFLFLIPAITMRFFAEEKKSGTLELLMTKPLTDLQVIMAKYLAGFTLVLISLIPTLVYFFSVYQLGFSKRKHRHRRNVGLLYRFVVSWSILCFNWCVCFIAYR